MNPLLLLLSLALPAPAQVSSGGAYALDRSAQASGSDGAAGSIYSLRSAAADPSAAAATSSDRLVGGAEDERAGFFNPAPLAISSAATTALASPSGDLQIVVPAGAMSTPAFDIIATRDPLANPMVTPPNAIAEANRKWNANSNGFATVDPNQIWEFNVTDAQGFIPALFSQPVHLSFGYSDSKNAGVVDGTNPPLRVKTLAVWGLDSVNQQWVRVPGSNVDPASRVVTADVYHFSVYSVMGAADEDVAGAYAYPVPFRPNGPNAGAGPGQTGTEAAGITFTNLPSEGDIEIYTLTGQLVREIDIPVGLPLAQIAWDARNGAGQAVASGVYLWKVASRTTNKTGRLMVIR